MIDKDQASIVKTNINLIRYEQDNLADLWTDYDYKVATSIIEAMPENDLEYKLAELNARKQYKQLYNKIMKKQNEIENLQTLLEHKEEIAYEYKQFEKKALSHFRDNNNDVNETLDMLMKILGDD